MRKLIKGQKGLSLVEVTIMLLVLMLLTSVLAPSIWDFVHDAQWVKVKEDCEAIGISFSRLTRDIGPCLRTNHLMPCQIAYRVDVLYSQGTQVVASTVTASPISALNMTTNNWYTAAAYNTDSMENQFVLNTPAYNTPAANYPLTYPVGPLFGLGWRGAYLAPPIGPDPWGTAYYVNSGFNAVTTDGSSLAEGGPGRWWERDVICISAGPDQSIATSFGYAANWGLVRQADDFVYVISGSGR